MCYLDVDNVDYVNTVDNVDNVDALGKVDNIDNVGTVMRQSEAISDYRGQNLENNNHSLNLENMVLRYASASKDQNTTQGLTL